MPEPHPKKSNRLASSSTTESGRSRFARTTRHFLPSTQPMLCNLTLALGCVVMSLALGGCVLGQLIGGMAASAHEAGSSEVDAHYTGLEGHTFAVVATADRSIQAEFPALVPTIMQRLDLQLAKDAGASGHVPGDEVTGYLSNHPQWVAWPRARLAEELGVERIVFLEINDFRTNESGNEYLWNGLVWGTVSIIEQDTAGGTDMEVYHKDLQITFPDGGGFGPDDMSKQVVAGELLRRFIQRAAWLFYDHEEENSLEY